MPSGIHTLLPGSPLGMHFPAPHLPACFAYLYIELILRIVDSKLLSIDKFRLIQVNN
jgi:hypothetical protein